MPTFNRYLNGIIRAEHITADAVTTAKIADDAVTDALTAATIPKTLKFVFDGASQTTGAKTLVDGALQAQTLPAGVLLKDFLIVPDETFTSSGSATIALGFTGVAAGIMAATAFDNAELAPATFGWRPCATAGATAVGTSGAHSVLLTIGSAAITAGSCTVYITYIENVI